MARHWGSKPGTLHRTEAARRWRASAWPPSSRTGCRCTRAARRRRENTCLGGAARGFPPTAGVRSTTGRGTSARRGGGPGDHQIPPFSKRRPANSTGAVASPEGPRAGWTQRFLHDAGGVLEPRGGRRSPGRGRRDGVRLGVSLASSLGVLREQRNVHDSASAVVSWPAGRSRDLVAHLLVSSAAVLVAGGEHRERSPGPASPARGGAR